MTAAEYRAALTELSLTITGAGAALGISPRMSQYYAAGRYPVPATVAYLLNLKCLFLGYASQPNRKAPEGRSEAPPTDRG